NTWHRDGGWDVGTPTTPKPAPDAAVAVEVAARAGGPQRLAERALALAAVGDEASLRLAGHLVELAALAAPDDAGVHRARAEVFGRRAGVELSTMAKGVLAWAENESRE